MARSKRAAVIAGAVIFVVLVGAGLVGGIAYVVARSVRVDPMSAEGGQAEFNRLAAAMAGQTPLIEMPAPGSGGEPVVHRELETHDTGSISTLHVRVWSPSARKLTRVDLPFWIMRLGGNRPVTIDAGAERRLRLQVRPEEIDRRGPGLILRWTTAREHQVLVWTE